MRRFITIVAWLCLLAPSAAAASPLIAYTHAHWWTGSRFVQGTRYVQSGLFVEPGHQRVNRTVDLKGRWVVPPYADAHNHMPGPPDQVSETATRAGVFYLMNPTIMASTAPALRRALRGPGKVDAVLSMGAITAPGGHPEPLYVDILRPRVYPNVPPDKFLGDAFHYVTKASDIGPVLNRLQSQGAEFVKIMVLNSEEFDQRTNDPARRGHSGLNPALVAPLVAEAHRRGLRVAAHIETAADFRVIVAAGVDEAAHMPGYYGDVGASGRYAITDADAAAAARSHIVVVATASLAADSNQGRPERLAEAQAVQRANLEKLEAAGVPLLIGTDGQPDDALKEVRYLVRLGVLAPKAAIKTLTETTPQWIFPKRRIGRIEPGYEASFLVLGGDPTLSIENARDIRLWIKQGFEFTPREMQPTLAITHVNVVPMDRNAVLPDRTILIAGERIVAIRRDTKAPKNIPIIDGHRRYAMPGLWDMHVHVLSSSDFPPTDKMLHTLLAGGVTGVRDMGSTMAQLQRFKAARDAGGGPWPDLIGAGPVINGPATPWSRPNEAHVSTPAQARLVVEAQIAAGSEFIKPYSGLGAASYAAVADTAHGAGLVLGGHLPWPIDLQTAIATGQRSVEHMEVHLSKSCGSTAPAKAAEQWLAAYAQSGLAAREKVELALRAGRNPRRCRALLKRMAGAPLWWTPTLVLDFADPSFVDDEFVKAAGEEGADACRSGSSSIKKAPADLRRRALDAELADVSLAHRAGVKILAGTDMPTPCSAPLASLHRELELFVEAGMTPFEALKTATREPADYFGRADLGALKVGNVADIVLLDRNPLRDISATHSVRDVVLHGQVVQSRQHPR
jgi:imidazolonepropionase-like amidohydrolase